MFTRQDLLNNVCSHNEYYAQFVNGSTRATVCAHIGKERIVKALETDEHLNNIPLAQWDAMTRTLDFVARQIKATGDWLCPAGGVCVLKEAARQIANGTE